MKYIIKQFLILYVIISATASWTEWVKEMENCSVTCGSGSLVSVYKRTCSAGVDSCIGSDTKNTISECSLRKCPESVKSSVPDKDFIITDNTAVTAAVIVLCIGFFLAIIGYYKSSLELQGWNQSKTGKAYKTKFHLSTEENSVSNDKDFQISSHGEAEELNKKFYELYDEQNTISADYNDEQVDKNAVSVDNNDEQIVKITDKDEQGWRESVEEGNNKMTENLFSNDNPVPVDDD